MTIPEIDIGRALGTDYFLLRDELTEDELDCLDRTRRFVEEEVLPVMPGYWERARNSRSEAANRGPVCAWPQALASR
jgi:glutaryl-CoA dehydrogenase